MELFNLFTTAFFYGFGLTFGIVCALFTAWFFKMFPDVHTTTRTITTSRPQGDRGERGERG